MFSPVLWPYRPVNFMSELVAKRLGLLRELLPAAARVGALVNPNAATAEDFVKDFAAAASTLVFSLRSGTRGTVVR
jgi:hypothetical protein